MNSLEKSISNMTEYLDLLSCPKCRTGFAVEGSSLVCGNGHCFDIASKRYLNFLDSTPKALRQYDQKLFAARRDVFKRGMFNPVIERLSELTKGCDVLLDAGCGEGYILSQIGKKTSGTRTIGLDISKQGILAAEKESGLWIVGDLAKIPLAENSCGIVLNILSPARYSEFTRVLKPGGLLIKAVPNKAYLMEIRDFYRVGAGCDHFDDGSASIFKNHFTDYSEDDISFIFGCDSDTVRNVLQMTPMLEHVDYERKERFVSSGINSITVDIKILSTTIQ